MSDQELNSGIGELRDRVGKLEIGFETMRKDLADNTTATRQIASDTGDLVEFTRAVSWVAKIAKPAGYVTGFLASVAALWAAAKAGIGIR